jgi:hypothetical protein
MWQVLVLLQSKHVLTRPFCLLELLTAIDSVRLTHIITWLDSA